MKHFTSLVLLGSCLSVLLWNSSCVLQPAKVSPNSIETTLQAFYTTYQERNDFNHFMSYYADTVVFEDIISAVRIEGREDLKSFFDWENPAFSKLTNNALELSELIVESDKAVVKGHFLPFSWNGQKFEAMYFTTWLYFNEDQKIIRQTDWINYPNSLLDYSQRLNANEWIE